MRSSAGMTIGLAVLLAALTLIAPLPLSTPASGSDGWQPPPVPPPPGGGGAGGGLPQATEWAAPCEGAEVCVPVLLQIRVRTDRRVCSATFTCQEMGDGAHAPGPVEGCRPTSTGQSQGTGLVGTTWFPHLNTYGHNGTWVLRCTVVYATYTMPPAYETVTLPDRTVTVKNVVTTVSSPCKPAGMPAGGSIPGSAAIPPADLPEGISVVCLDPDAPEGSALKTPTLEFQFDCAAPLNPTSVITVSVYDLVGGGIVASADRARLYALAQETPPRAHLEGNSGWWQWDGRNNGGGALSAGLYGFTASVGRMTLDGDFSHSDFLGINGVSASVGACAGGQLPVTLSVDLRDRGGLPASAVAAYVVDASADNEKTPEARFRVVGGGHALSTTGEATTIQLDPLDGSPYYIIVHAIDSHGGETTPGDKPHANRPAPPMAIRIDTGVTEVWPRQSTTNPNTTGHVYVSDTLAQFPEAPLLFRRPAGTPVRCQTANSQANIEALVELTVVDSDPTNDATSTSATCGGMQVYFRSRDPDSNTLWDQSSEGVDNPDTDDNVDKAVGEGRGTVTPEISEAVADQVGGDPATSRAVATTTLTFTDHQAGDNYVVDASTCQMPATAAQASSGVLTVWKLIYYERDSMFRWGRLLAEGHAANAGDTHLDVHGGSTAFVGQTIVVFDPAHQDPTDVLQQHQVTAVVGDRLMITPPLNYNYQGGPVGSFGVVQTPPLVNAVDLGRLGAGGEFGNGFVEWRQHPGVTRPIGLFPTFVFRGFVPAQLPYFETSGQPNVVHLIDGLCFAPGPPNANRSGMSLGFQAIVMSLYSDGSTPMGASVMQETVVHECGHFFGMADFAQGHLDHANHMRTDGCVMVYSESGGATHPNDFGNGVAAFGGPVPSVGEPPDASQPVDLRNAIAGGPDPLPGAAP